MKNKYLIIGCLLSWGTLLHAQGILNNGASIVVKQGAEVVIDGSDGGFTNQTFDGTDGKVFLDGQISVRGNWLNNAGGTVFADPDETGLMVFGNEPDKALQELGGTGVTRFENLTVNSGTTAKIPAEAEIRVMYDFILNGTLDIHGDLYIEGSFTNNGEISGTGTVHYESTSPQMVAPGYYPNLVLDNSGGLILTDEVYVETELVLSLGSLVLGDKNLVLGPNCIITETKAPGTWVDATGTGMVIKMFDKTGTFEFPVGNFGSNPVYSPVTVELLSATFNQGQIGVRLRAEVHPDNNTGPDFLNYLTRYWEVTAEGLSDLEYNARFFYDPSDVVGNEAEIEGAKFIDADGLWKHFSHVNADENYFDALALNSFSVFTGAQENRIPEVAISYPAEGGSVYDTTVTVTGTAHDIDGDLWEVYLRVNEGTWQLASGKTNWSLKIPLSFGYKKIEAKSVDYQDAESVKNDKTFFTGVQLISLYNNWSQISSFLNPLQSDIETIMQYPVGQNLLTLLVNRKGGVYWPSQNINTIGNWNPHSAYKIKMEAQSSMMFTGDVLTSSSLIFEAGASYLPVITNVETELHDAIENPEENVRIIYNTYTNEVYWPEGGISTLSSFIPGTGYLANFKNPVTVTFNPYNMWPDEAKAPVAMPPAEGPWPITRTGEVHLISVFKHALDDLDNYSFIGAFNSGGLCIGFCDISSTNQNVLLTVYGDDINTVSKDGAECGELISFRAYNAATCLETNLEATYNQSFPNHDGLFSLTGLSAIVGFKKGATGIGVASPLSQISVYPNPAKEELNLVFDNFSKNGKTKVQMVNSTGSNVYESEIYHAHTKLDVSKLQPGIYVLKIIINRNITFRKVIIQ